MQRPIERRGCSKPRRVQGTYFGRSCHRHRFSKNVTWSLTGLAFRRRTSRPIGATETCCEVQRFRGLSRSTTAEALALRASDDSRTSSDRIPSAPDPVYVEHPP